MPYLPDILKDRARVVGEIVGPSPIWRWGNYSRDDEIIGNYGSHDDVQFIRGSDSKARMYFRNVTPTSVRDVDVTEPIVLKTRVIDALFFHAQQP